MRFTIFAILLFSLLNSYAQCLQTGVVARVAEQKVVLANMTCNRSVVKAVSGVSSDDYSRRIVPKDAVSEIDPGEFSMLTLPCPQREYTSFCCRYHEPSQMRKVPTEWYDMFYSKYGSRAYWILAIARARADRGESVSDLKDRFDATIRAWLSCPEK